MHTSPYNAGKHFHDALVLWWEQNVIADDPEPEYSLLDKMDGLSKETK